MLVLVGIGGWIGVLQTILEPVILGIEDREVEDYVQAHNGQIRIGPQMKEGQKTWLA